MKLTINTFLGAACLAIGLVGSQTTASAIPITGGLSFSGNATPQNSTGVAQSNLTLATQVFFPTGQQSVSNGTGSFSGIPYGTIVSMFVGQPLLNNTLKFGAPQNTPILSFYTVAGFTFDLLTIAVGPDTTTPTTLSITGTGTFSGNGFTPTRGTYLAQFGTAGGSFSFAASGAALPDGGTTVALLGLSLVAIEAGRRVLGARSSASA